MTCADSSSSPRHVQKKFGDCRHATTSATEFTTSSSRRVDRVDERRTNAEAIEYLETGRSRSTGRGDPYAQVGRSITFGHECRGTREELTNHGIDDLLIETLRATSRHQRLGDEEQIGRTTTDQTGHGVEVALGDSYDETDRAENRLGPDEIGFDGETAPGDRRRALTHERRRVWHGPNYCDIGTARLLETGDSDAGSDREHPACPGRYGISRRVDDVGRFDRNQCFTTRRDRVDDRQTGEHLAEHTTSIGRRLDDDDRRLGDGPGRHQASDERRSHVSSADDGEHGR